MANKLTRKRPNVLLTGRNNYFEDGGQPQQGVFKQAFGTLGQAFTNPGAALGSIGPMALAQGISTGIGVAGQAIGNGISGGLSSGAGNIVNTVGDVVSGIPLIGGLAKGVLNVVGGGVNALFGMKTNKEELQRVSNNVNTLQNAAQAASQAQSFDDAALNGPAGINFNVNAYKGGLFKKGKARRKNAALAAELKANYDFANRTSTNTIDNLSDDQMDNLMGTFAAYGGPLFAFGGDLMTHGANFDTGITLVGNGNTHEQNPYEGVPMGMDSEGTPNLVEEGEVIYDDYVFSNRLKVPKQIKEQYKLKGKKAITFAEAALQMSKESEERPNDPISQNGLNDSMMKLMMIQEQVRAKKNKGNSFATGGRMGRKYQGPGPYNQTLLIGDVNDTSWMNSIKLPDEDITQSDWWKTQIAPLATSPIDPATTMASAGDQTAYPSKEAIPTDSLEVVGDRSRRTKTKTKKTLPTMSSTWMRYFPAAASGIMSLTDALGWTNKPDYSEADAALEAARSAGTYTPISFSPIGNYLTYTPFDTEFAANQANAESNSARRAILNTSGGNRAQAMAGILASNNNALNQLGVLRRGAAEDNRRHMREVEEFNRGTNMFNSEGKFKADSANLSAQMQARSEYLRGALTAAEMRQKERQTSMATRSANLSNFINSIGDIGRENFQRNMIMSDPSKYYTIGANGEISYKKSFDDLSDAEKDYVTGHATRKSKSKARGGYLTIKRK